MADQGNPLLEDIETDRSSSGNYVLNGVDRKYCITGDPPGSYKNRDLKSRIRDKRLKALPQRFQDLFDDIALIEFAETEFLTHEQKVELWNEIIDVESRGETTLGHSIQITKQANREERTKFGFELGAVLRSIGVYSDPKASDSVEKIDVLWGILLGLCGTEVDSLMDEFAELEDVISTLDERVENRILYREGKFQQNERQSDLTKSLRSKVVKAFKNLKVPTNQPIVPLSKIIKEGDSIPPTMTTNEIEKVLEDIVKIDQVKNVVELKNIAERDGKVILNMYWKKEYADEVISELWQNAKSEDNDWIRLIDLNSVSSYNTGATLKNRLSTSQRQELHTQYPIIQGNNNGYGLTDYGKLIAYCLFDRGGDFDWIGRGIQIEGQTSLLSEMELDLIQKAASDVDISLKLE